ncbi:winged helix-turn-helix domain-containing protein, partial [Rhodoferax sp. UBA5149]|uniref:winged helix-turn-helix domain-containing protein n=1 Tax=Rhodoferax sp. UBA5149 TaxID=1947379 RepID=UPI0039C8D685
MLKLLKQEFGIELHISTIGEYPKHWGFTPQKAHHQGLRQHRHPRVRITSESTPKHRASPRHAGHGCWMTVVRWSRVWV